MAEGPTRPAAHPPFVELLRAVRAAGGDAESDAPLTALLERLHPVVERFALARVRAYRDAADIAADVAQETLVRVAGAAHECRAESDGELMAWVLTVARRVLIDLWRAPGSRLGFQQLAANLDAARGVGGASMDADTAIGRRAPADPAHETLLRLAVEAYNQTPEATASLIWWRLVGGAGWAEISVRYLTTEAGAKRRFQRAQRTLRSSVVRLVAALPAAEREAVERLLRQYEAAHVGPARGGAT